MGAVLEDPARDGSETVRRIRIRITILIWPTQISYIYLIGTYGTVGTGTVLF